MLHVRHFILLRVFEMRRRLTALLLLGVVLPAALPAQTATVRGRGLHAETRRPIAGATVALRAAMRETRTDSFGQFEIGNLQLGEYELVVQAVGFTPARAILPLAAGPPVELPLPRFNPLGTATCANPLALLS